MASVIEELEGILEPVLEHNGFELVDLEYKKEGGRWMLRVFIDGPHGISHEECSRVTRLLSPVLEEEDIIPHSYILEVSSPGLDRPLKKEADFQRFRGKGVMITTFAPIENQRKFRGTLMGLQDDCVVVENEQGDEIHIPMESIAKARLQIEI